MQQPVDPRIQEFIQKVRPLDLLVFQGGEFVSNIISFVEKEGDGTGSVTHVGVAINDSFCPLIKISPKLGLASGRMCTWESTMSGPLNDGVYDAETDTSFFGVQIRDLEEVITGYLQNPKANIGLCRLKNNPCFPLPDESWSDYLSRSADLIQKIETAYKNYNGTRYNPNFLDLLASVFPKLRPFRNLEDETLGKLFGMNKWLFCSEFVTVVYEAVGIISPSSSKEEPNYRDVTPVDFLPNVDDQMPSIVEAPIWIK